MPTLKAPYHPNGSLLHHVSDYSGFDHYETKDGTRLEREDIWEPVEPVDRDPMAFWRGPLERQIRDDWVRVNHQPEWRDNEPFHATLEISHMNRGRSAKYLTLKPLAEPLDPRTYPMFIVDFVALARTGLIQKGGIISGRWIACGRGQNFGLRLTKEGE